MATRFSTIAVGAVIAATLLSLGFLVYQLATRTHTLPVLGEPGHHAGKFAFTNQQAQPVTEQTVQGKIAVVEYFFTTCPGICKIMNEQLQRVNNIYGNDTSFVILSHTVDPEHDSVPVMAAYAPKIGAKLPTWQLLTGGKYELYRMARQDYLLAVEDSANDNLDFIHTEYVALLDRQRRIRGFYDATNKEAVDRLIKDIGILREE